jgi:hypothetical protein
MLTVAVETPLTPMVARLCGSKIGIAILAYLFLLVVPSGAWDNFQVSRLSGTSKHKSRYTSEDSPFPTEAHMILQMSRTRKEPPNDREVAPEPLKEGRTGLAAVVHQVSDLSVLEAALISGHRDPRMLNRYTHLRAREGGGEPG